jgi:hypothetical protein
MFEFNPDDFFIILERYNVNFWPLQVIAFIMALISTILALTSFKYASKIILTTLIVFWLWTGVVFSAVYWAEIYVYAYMFAALWVIQVILFIFAFFRNQVSFRFGISTNGIVGLIFILYAIAGYQLFGHFIGHAYPRFFPVGMVPCPTVIFTFGILLLAEKNLPKYLIIIPFISALAGILAASNNIIEDFGLVAAGLIGSVLIMIKNRQASVAKM